MLPVTTLFKSKKNILGALVLFGILAIAILYSVKSWRLFFFIGLAEHWDPQLMGEWMAWNAHNILHGHFLLPNYHANFFYPHSYTLAFSELLWPESFLYALFYALTGNLFFSFNATMLFFWALSGIAFFALLRMLDISPLVSALGSFIYCLMPYRMPYYVEFNMVLVFIFPLMILLLVRWLQDPSFKNALWFCLGFLISATSCLYYTIMAIIIMVFVSLAFLAGDRTMLRNRKFYLSGGLLVSGVFAVSCIYLYPYALLRIQGGYQRSTADYLKYFAQPMQYLDTGCTAFLKWMSIPTPRFTETFLFPGTVLSILILIFLVYQCVVFCKRYTFLRKTVRCIAMLQFLLWIIFWSVILLHAYRGRVAWLQWFDPFLYHLAVLLILLSILRLFFLEDSERTPGALLGGLAAAAILCFFISFGPFISVGPDDHRLVLARGPFLDLASWNPLFSAVRSLTRFSIVVLTYLAVTGCYVLNKLVQKNRKVIWLVPVLIAMLVYEARHMVHYKFEDSTGTIHSKVIQEAQNLPGDHVLFQLPIAIRKAEANFVMTTIGKFPLIINGWSGFEPDFYRQLFVWEEGTWGVDKDTTWATQIWPPAYLIIDHAWVIYLEGGWNKPFPWKDVEQSWELIDRDTRFALYRQRKVVYDSSPVIRRVRTDILKAHPLLSFKAHRSVTDGDPSPVVVSVLLNNKIIKEKISLAEAWEEFTVPLPPGGMGNIKGDEIDIEVASLGPSLSRWEIKDIEFKELTQK
jgi:hypothetical protein